MTIEVLGLLYHANQTEFRPADKPFDPDFVRRHARLYDEAGFDGVLIGQHARSPDPLAIAANVAACTQKLRFMIAHRPGFVSPTIAARMFATIDRVSGGRCIAHIITAASDAETENDGDFLTKDQRYARSREYVEILRKVWTSPSPVDHDGPFYSFEKAFCEAKPLQQPTIPIFWGGASDRAIEMGAECADVYAMGPGTVEKTAQLLNRVRAAATPHGRSPDFLMTMRIVMAPKADDAWKKARDILDAVTAFQNSGGTVGRAKGDIDQRIVAEAEAARDSGDPCLWTDLTIATKGRTAATALVGSPEQITEALLRYHAVGISRFILTGFDPIDDTIAIGRALIPRLKGATPSAHHRSAQSARG
jgi:alkanesulfonate monooxygenase